MSTPSLNVNLRNCECPPGTNKERSECSAAPVLIPCPVPRSVTFEVVLGWLCDCRDRENSTHLPRCPCEVVRVSCSISGKTWEESEIAECGVVDGGQEVSVRGFVLTACRDRWALVKALALGAGRLDPTLPSLRGIESSRITRVIDQRDAVFAALADMARAESVHTEKHRAMFTVLSDAGVSWSTSFRVMHSEAESGLAAYVERLIEQVGAL